MQEVMASLANGEPCALIVQVLPAPFRVMNRRAAAPPAAWVRARLADLALVVIVQVSPARSSVVLSVVHQNGMVSCTSTLPSSAMLSHLKQRNMAPT